MKLYKVSWADTKLMCDEYLNQGRCKCLLDLFRDLHKVFSGIDLLKMIYLRTVSQNVKVLFYPKGSVEKPQSHNPGLQISLF